MKRVSGLLMLLLVALLFSMPVAADNLELSNDLFQITEESKIVAEEEIAGIRSGETLVVLSAGPCRPEELLNNKTGLLVAAYNLTFIHIEIAGINTPEIVYQKSQTAGGIQLSAGFT